VGEVHPLFDLTIAGYHLVITDSVVYNIVMQWAIMLLIVIIVSIFTRKFNTVPKGAQVWVETIVEKVNGLVRDNMGENYMRFAPYIGTLMIYLLLLNLIGLIGLRPPTTDYSVTLGLALMSFVIIHATAIKRNGLGHYLAGYAHPYAFMLPLNIVERFVVPVSLSLRLFGNITAAVIIVELLYEGLAHFSHLMHLPVPLLQAVIPIPFHLYFDIFDGSIQMFIFVMLTMIFTKTTTEH
jgi:F-type H+-transporting ATPase subunit a